MGFSRAAHKYVLSDWQTELNRFVATLDREFSLCGGNSCTCPWHDAKKQVATASMRSLWEPSIQTACAANAKPYSYEHWQAENRDSYQDYFNFCSDSVECDHSILRRSVLPEEEWPSQWPAR